MMKQKLSEDNYCRAAGEKYSFEGEGGGTPALQIKKNNKEVTTAIGYRNSVGGYSTLFSGYGTGYVN